MRIRKVGLLGYGNIGQGVWEILNRQHSQIIEKLRAEIEITKILIRNKDKYIAMGLPEEKLTTVIDDILNDPEIEVIIELIGGVHPAYEYIQKAITQGKHVVTANKAVMALYGTELLALANEHGTFLRFEGSVGGGMPVIAALTQSLTANKIQEIVGIVNGTTNYILTRMTKDNLPLEQALSLAQSKGYAEADPSSDLEGEDAAFKLAILANIAFGVQALPDNIPREGILRITNRDIEYATQLGYTIKLLAIAKEAGGVLELHVHPALVPSDHPLAAVSDEFNALYITGDSVGQLMLYGKGAGGLPTGSAVVNDLLSVFMQEGINNEQASVSKNDSLLNVVGETESEYYIRLQVLDRPGVLGLVTTIFGKHGISLSSVVQRGKSDDIVPLIFITHTAAREALDNALMEISEIEDIKEVASILRVENL